MSILFKILIILLSLMLVGLAIRHLYRKIKTFFSTITNNFEKFNFNIDYDNKDDYQPKTILAVDKSLKDLFINYYNSKKHQKDKRNSKSQRLSRIYMKW
ncbi:MAG: hypothetical protein LBT85_02210 [Bifidobacteriaceae bacterium]|jgi:hypothetical protein|nr:hypothetical protein [Bifidobacteriaceae bacterium]